MPLTCTSRSISSALCACESIDPCIENIADAAFSKSSRRLRPNARNDQSAVCGISSKRFIENKIVANIIEQFAAFVHQGRGCRKSALRQHSPCLRNIFPHQLRQKMMEEIRGQGKPFGLLI